MTIETRLAEIQARVDAATEGPWEARQREDGLAEVNTAPAHAPWMTDTTRPVVYEVVNQAFRADAEFIAHARVDVPWLLDQVELRDKALKDVLDLHAPKPIYVLAEECEAPEDHEHGTTSDGGEDICWDEPTGETYCNECNDVWGDPVDYPCPTVQAITAALETQDTTREDPS